jgi:hypothetical protein
MNEYEISLHINDKKYIDSLVVSLVRQGYEVYYNDEEDVVCFKTYDDDEVKKIAK